MKSIQVRTVCGHALGKNRDAIAVDECLADILIDARGIAALFAFDKQCAGFLAKPSHQRPGAHFRFGDKTRRTLDIEQVNVQPGNMVGDQHGAARQDFRQIAPDCKPDIQDVEKLQRPALKRLHLSCLAETGKENREPHGVEEMRNKPHYAVAPDKNAGWSLHFLILSGNPDNRAGSIIRAQQGKIDY